MGGESEPEPRWGKGRGGLSRFSGTENLRFAFVLYRQCFGLHILFLALFQLLHSTGVGMQIVMHYDRGRHRG